MHPSILILTLSSIAAASTLPPLKTARNDATDPMIVQWWENGCATDGDGNVSTYFYTTDLDDGHSHPGDCIAVPEYNWQSVQITQDSGSSYTVDLFSGEGCNNFIKTVSENGCYSQPEGQIFLSARANLK